MAAFEFELALELELLLPLELLLALVLALAFEVDFAALGAGVLPLDLVDLPLVLDGVALVDVLDLVTRSDFLVPTSFLSV